MMTRAIILAASALIATPVLAASVVTDSDGDGLYSWEELTAAFPDLEKKAFVGADTDKDGLISATELTAAQETGLIPA